MTTMSESFDELVDPTSQQTASADPTSADKLVSQQDTALSPAVREMNLISQSGLLDVAFYLLEHRELVAAGSSPLEHFYHFGLREGWRPNFYFDTAWYLSQNPDVREAGIHPLLHYIANGDIEGRRPSLLFDPSWYRTANGLAETECALSHYLVNRLTYRVSPIPDFDVEWYAKSYPDVVAAGVDPFEHFITQGYKEGRLPSSRFDPKFYAARYLRGDFSQNPFLHYLEHSHEPGVYGRMPENETTIPREVKRFTKPAAEFEEFVPLPPSAPRRAKLLTYYLPQFHTFAENDAWWGKGFTEWTNVPRGLPRFKEHYQPRIPRDLGFYSLDHAVTLRRQVQMAKGGGVYGFVFYYYWFNGKRLLDSPLEALMSDPSIEMPFCLMWANENWTRRWDGADEEILISQDYRLEDEAALLGDFARHFRDSRYIRVQGRPLLMIYRPGLISNCRSTITRWRELFRNRFNEDPILIMGQAFGATNPEPFEMDAAIEFPPHKLTQYLPSINSSVEYLDLEFEGKVYRYDDLVRTSLDERRPTFPLIKTAIPSWDNDARRQGKGLVVTGSTPQKYQAWLTELVDRAVREPFFGEAIVCVNAWNEWCEAAYLEPDLHYGAAYLNATARAIAGKALGHGNRVLLVGHDCFPSGAQHLLLNIGRTLRSHFGVETSFLLLDGGKLEAAYRDLGPVTIAAGGIALETQLSSLRGRGFASAIVNTSAAASLVPALTEAGFEVTLLVHELPRILREKKLEADARTAAERAARIVFAAPYVRDQFCAALDIHRDDGLLIIPQGLYQRVDPAASAREERRLELRVAPEQKLVVGVGYADLRKGFDLFLQLWRLVRASSDVDTHFCWVGDIDPGLSEFMKAEIQEAERTGSFHLLGYRADVPAFLAAADLFVLTSREDPYPSVVLEAVYAGLPALVFDRSGGIPDLLREYPYGHVVPYADTVAMAEKIIFEVGKDVRESARALGRDLIGRAFDFRAYVWRLLETAQPALPSISVGVPNYNYARHLPKRLSSIFMQTHPVKEIIVLDDCSTDHSLDVISATAAEWDRHITIVPNPVNSGSVFRQWRKAAEMASGEYLWIAEADDSCRPEFLTAVISLMKLDPNVQFAFSDSSSIDADGKLIWPSYKDYYEGLSPSALSRTEVFEAHEFVVRFLAVKNTILNVSAVVWRRDALLKALDASKDDLENFGMAGDWRLYLQASTVTGARVAYCSEPHNVHRRHGGSVTHALSADKHVAEIAACHAFSIARFGLGSDVRMKQTAYLAEVAKQLRANRVTPDEFSLETNSFPVCAAN